MMAGTCPCLPLPFRIFPLVFVPIRVVGSRFPFLNPRGYLRVYIKNFKNLKKEKNINKILLNLNKIFINIHNSL